MRVANVCGINVQEEIGTTSVLKVVNINKFGTILCYMNGLS